MALGPGKYDDLCGYARSKAQADGALLLIINGAKGSGFSAQLSPELTLTLPAILWGVAKQIEDFGPAS